MVTINKHELVLAVSRARLNAVAPYSKFKVGAALLTETGEIITGANVESASYGLTCCAERVALFKALTSGKRNFRRGGCGAHGRWAEVVRCLPAIAGRVRCQGKGVRCRQPKAESGQGFFRPPTFADSIRAQAVVSS